MWKSSETLLPHILQIESEAAEKEAQKAAEVERLHTLEADYKATLERLQSSMQQAEQQSALQARTLCYAGPFCQLLAVGHESPAARHKSRRGLKSPTVRSPFLQVPLFRYRRLAACIFADLTGGLNELAWHAGGERRAGSSAAEGGS